MGVLNRPGIVGIDPATNQLAGSTIQEQTHQALVNCESILRAAGANLENVVDVNILLASPLTRSAGVGITSERFEFLALSPEALPILRFDAILRQLAGTALRSDHHTFPITAAHVNTQLQREAVRRGR
jgi:hypothetical protein